ncbi:MAG: class I SAM-dependent methyltransferase, partial [Desulfitobacterium hafniense]|nr:class I SAM-dependent methyltransferase [Desulfitobacterium hafniense]
TFDRVVSIGMLEHVGKEHLGEYFAAVERLLEEKGISLLHTIAGRDESGTNSWINKYIFPGGYIPTVSELIKHMEIYGFYLNSAAASFHSGNIDLHQFLFSKGPNNLLPWNRNYIYRRFIQS